MFNEHVDLLAEATGFSAALDSSFLEQYDSLDDMVHEMICESYEDMLRFARFEHDADMAEAQMIVQQESVESIMAFQEGIYGKAKNFAKKIIDKIKIKWRKFCIWVNKKIVNFLSKRVKGMKDKADKAFDRITGDKPEVKYFSKSQDASSLLSNLITYFDKVKTQNTSSTKDGETIYYKQSEEGSGNTRTWKSAGKYRAKSLKKDFEDNVLGELDSTTLTKDMWNITDSDIKGSIAKMIKNGTDSVSKAIKAIEKAANKTNKFAKKDSGKVKKDTDTTDPNRHADVQAALNATNNIISAGSACLACARKVCWAALKAAARARLAGGSSTSDYEEEEEDSTRRERIFGPEKSSKQKADTSSSRNFDDDIDLSVF